MDFSNDIFGFSPSLFRKSGSYFTIFLLLTSLTKKELSIKKNIFVVTAQLRRFQFPSPENNCQVRILLIESHENYYKA